MVMLALMKAASAGDTIAGINTGVALLVGIVTLMSITFGGVALVRASLRSGDVKALREANSDLRERIDDLKGEAEERDRRIAILEGTLAAETDARKTLEKVVTGKELLEAIQQQLLTHDKAVVDHHRNHEERANARQEMIVLLLKDMRRDLLAATRSTRPDTDPHHRELP